MYNKNSKLKGQLSEKYVKKQFQENSENVKRDVY